MCDITFKTKCSYGVVSLCWNFIRLSDVIIQHHTELLCVSSDVSCYHQHPYQLLNVHVCILQKVNCDVFVDGVFTPCLRSGNISELQRQMTCVDPSLEKWSQYLTAVCKDLNKNGHINVLYQMQLFMKV